MANLAHGHGLAIGKYLKNLEESPAGGGLTGTPLKSLSDQ